MGYVRKVSRERPLQAGFFSSLDRRPPNLGVKEVKFRQEL
jgi:hypothetical protein